MPRSLTWRLALMIVIPLLVLQSLISLLIVQRYYDLVTEQLSSAVIQDLKYFEEASDDLASFYEAIDYFDYRVSTNPPLEKNHYGFADLSGRYIRSNFAKAYGEDVRIASEHKTQVELNFPTRLGDVQLFITRSKLAPVNPHQILLNIIGFMLISLVMIFLFLRGQLRSVRKLALAAEAYGRGQTIPYTPTGADEVRMAGRNFIAMRERINRQREQRNLMLSGVSHDFRTPLTRFKLAIEMLEDESSKKELLSDVAEMEYLIDSFLDYSRDTANEEFELWDFADYMEATLGEDRNLQASPPPKVDITLKPFLIKRALLNLIGNAKRYGESLQIQYDVDKSSIQIHIDDDGPGIDEEHREQALVAFRRFDQSRNQNQGAHAGLGLAIAADAVRQHGGNLKLSDSPLGGLRATITLPLTL